MPERHEEAFKYALTMLSELLTTFPKQPALLDAAESMDLSDELWLALRIVRMKTEDKQRLRDFLLVHSKTGVVQLDGGTLLIGGERH